jgi:hypothetical protein
VLPSVREGAGEAVVVEERRLQGEAEHRGTHGAGGGRGRARAGEVVVVQLVEEGQARLVGHLAGEVVGVGVEQRQVRERVHEPAQRRRAQPEPVEVDGRHRQRRVRGRRVRAVEAPVRAPAGEAVAELGAQPRGRHAWITGYSAASFWFMKSVGGGVGPHPHPSTSSPDGALVTFTPAGALLPVVLVTPITRAPRRA